MSVITVSVEDVDKESVIEVSEAVQALRRQFRVQFGKEDLVMGINLSKQDDNLLRVFNWITYSSTLEDCDAIKRARNLHPSARGRLVTFMIKHKSMLRPEWVRRADSLFHL